MTMTHDQLRALADALDPSGKVLTHPGDSALQRAADYLRAQADAQPVATLTLLDDMGAQIDFRQSFTLLPGQTFSLYAHPAPQAEPTREPLSDERIIEIQRAAYERAAQECIETAAELRRCADGCTDGRYDWEADGALDCADAIHALGRRQ